MRFILTIITFLYIGNSFAYNHPVCQSEESFIQFAQGEQSRGIIEQCKYFGIQANMGKVRSKVASEINAVKSLYEQTCSRCARETKEGCKNLIDNASYVLKINYQHYMKKEEC